jgi:hypothetical protein
VATAAPPPAVAAAPAAAAGAPGADPAPPRRDRAPPRRQGADPIGSLPRCPQAGFGDFFNKLRRHTQPRSKQGPDRAPKPRKPNPNARAASSPASVSSSAPQQPPAAGAGACPMRRLLGPMSGLVFNSYGKLQCPEPIIKMRAALAATQPVRELRPQALPVKLLAVGAVSAAVNVPCGAWREHFEKFSPGWFAAVHASIPFIAMLRKAVIMPKFAILYTLATAIAGQTLGSRMERRRLQQERAAAAAEAAGAAPEPLKAARVEGAGAPRRGGGGGGRPGALACVTLAAPQQRQRRRQGQERQQLQLELWGQREAAGGEDCGGWLPCHLEFKQATAADWGAPCLVR